MRVRPHQTIDPGGHQRGVSMLEVSIVSVMSVISLGVFYGAALSVSDMTVASNKEARIRARQHDVLATIRRELEGSGRNGRLVVAPDNKSVSYQKLIGASQNGADVSGIWSQTYTITLDKTGQVVRREPGKIVSWGTGVKELLFYQVPGEADVTVVCKTVRHGEDELQKIHVHPRN